MPSYPQLLLLTFFPTAFMTGLIWYVQIAHYPLFSDVGAERYAEYMVRYQRQVTLVVLPLMLLELAGSIGLVIASGDRTSWLGLALLLVIWGSTAFLQVPAHGKLTDTFSAQALQQLVGTNWIRTVCWTLRSVILYFTLSKQL